MAWFGPMWTPRFGGGGGNRVYTDPTELRALAATATAVLPQITTMRDLFESAIAGILRCAEGLESADPWGMAQGLEWYDQCRKDARYSRVELPEREWRHGPDDPAGFRPVR